MTAYHLPHSPQNRVLDRFSTLPDDAEGEDGLVPLWSLLLALLDRDVTTANEAIDLLGEIAVLLRDKSGDYATLRNVLPGYMSCWPKIVGHARALSTFEPTLPLLVPGETRIIPRPHLQSMVAHQFLTTLMRPPHRPDEENGWADFEIWYHSELPHQAAAEMYLAGVLTFLGKDADGDVQFDFRAPVSPHLDVPMAPIRISLMEEYVAPHPDAMVVSANQVIGFGRSATQEEIYFGCAPEVCPAVLFVPPLGASALIISSVSPTLRIRGARRQISSEIATQTPHTFVLMDALELDEADSGDLHPDNMDREIAKAATAFGGVGGVDGTGGTGGSGGPRRIATPAWGCGAFCGDPGVKLPLLWIAASSAGAESKRPMEGGRRGGGGVSLTAAVTRRRSAANAEQWGGGPAPYPNNAAAVDLDWRIKRICESSSTHQTLTAGIALESHLTLKTGEDREKPRTRGRRGVLSQGSG